MDQKQKLARSRWWQAIWLWATWLGEQLKKKERTDAIGSGLGIPDLATPLVLEASQAPC